jgi:hypothetical protein
MRKALGKCFQLNMFKGGGGKPSWKLSTSSELQFYDLLNGRKVVSVGGMFYCAVSALEANIYRKGNLALEARTNGELKFSDILQVDKSINFECEMSQKQLDESYRLANIKVWGNLALDAHTSVELQFCDMLHGRLARSN